ncbi:MAG: hypothetical protein AUK35_02725 [Zetaproteobacteria bacterium CG2_30_46_52]|nr:MAG: hypothetical protein AUK35_02725 [Zetaproteobacteria bacterium CG2_30_46_52]
MLLSNFQMNTFRFWLAGFLLSMVMHNSAQAGEYMLDEIGLGYGHGLDATSWTQLDLIRPLPMPFNALEGLPLHSDIDIGLAVSNWETSGATAYHSSATILLRSDQLTTPFGSYFLEAGFGPHLISRPGKTRRLSTAFEFNSLLGLGLVLTPEWRLLMRAHHVSNGGISTPNSGVNVYLIQLHYLFP